MRHSVYIPLAGTMILKEVKVGKLYIDTYTDDWHIIAVVDESEYEFDFCYLHIPHVILKAWKNEVKWRFQEV